MMNLPPAESIDWGNVSLWVAGIVTVIGSAGVAVWKAIQNAAKIAAAIPAPIHTDTKIITTDSVAMHELAGSLEGLNVSVRELHALLKAEITERDQEEERERLKRELMEDIRREAEMVERQRDPEPAAHRPPRKST